MYEALHLTEISRSFDDSKDSEGAKRGEYATNESHAVDRQIIRMMLAMPDLVGTRRKCRLQSGNSWFLTPFCRILSSPCSGTYVDGLKGETRREHG